MKIKIREDLRIHLQQPFSHLNSDLDRYDAYTSLVHDPPGGSGEPPSTNGGVMAMPLAAKEKRNIEIHCANPLLRHLRVPSLADSYLIRDSSLKLRFMVTCSNTSFRFITLPRPYDGQKSSWTNIEFKKKTSKNLSKCPKILQKKPKNRHNCQKSTKNISKSSKIPKNPSKIAKNPEIFRKKAPKCPKILQKTPKNLKKKHGQNIAESSQLQRIVHKSFKMSKNP